MVGEIIKSTFQHNKPHIIWTFQQGAMIDLVETAQKPNGHARL